MVDHDKILIKGLAILLIKRIGLAHNIENISGFCNAIRLGTNSPKINVDGDLKTDIEMEREIRRLRASLDLALEKNERLEAELVEYKAKEALSKEQAV